MEVKIKQPAALYEAGNQELNQDFIFPLHNQANPEENLFVVCDGEGGLNRGDIASKLVALSFAKYFASNPPKKALDQSYLDSALQTAEEALSAYQESHPESKGMATTFALLHIGEDQVTLGWVGDTQIYYYNRKKRQLSNPSAERGKPEARIRGSHDPQSMLVMTIPSEEIKAGDAFFMATRGVNEALEKDTLDSMLQVGAEYAPEQVLEQIKKISQTGSKENYSGYLVQIEKVQQAVMAGFSNDSPPDAAKGIPQSDAAALPEAGRARQIRNLFIGAIVVVLLGLIAITLYQSLNNPFRDAVKKGDKLMADKNFEEARKQYQEARSIADSNGNHAEMEKAQAKMQMALDSFTNSNLASINLDNLDQLISQGTEFFDKENYRDAIQKWEAARQMIAQSGAEDTLLPRQPMAEAYVKLADEAYTGTPPDYAQAAEYYSLAMAMLESPELKGFDEKARKQIAQRLENSQVQLGPQSQALADNSAPTRSRSLGSNSRETTPPTPSTSATARRVASPEESTPGGASTQETARRVQPEASTLDTQSLSAEERATLQKNLSTGKRFFSEAKQQDSQYLFRASEEKLLAAGPLLDGPGAYLLANIYHMGMGVDQDEKKALRYAQLSAKKNWPAGQYYYAFLLLQRQNPRDTVTAMQSLQLASNRNYPDAITLLQKLK